MRVALIGLGGVGKLHLDAYRAANGIDIVAAAEIDDARREALLAPFGVPGFSDHRRMLKECKPDIACVLTPACTHEQIVLDCATAGVHVLCEKPMALTLESARRIKAACEAAGVQFCYGASYRYLPAVAAARTMIDQGAIGRIQLLREELLGGQGEERWQPLPPHHYPAGGPGGSGLGLMDHGIHLIDVFRWFTGQEIIRSLGRGVFSGGPPVPEYLQMDFSAGALGLLLYNDASFPASLPTAGMFAEGAGWDCTGFVPAGGWSASPGSIEVYGTTGSLRIFHYANVLIHFSAAGARRIPLSGRASTAHFATQIESFAAALRLGTPPPVSADDGIHALAAALCAYGDDR
ncbi:MAG: Gfo/Idh/MocA family oxidoreductase [Steroidobacteraceae bacterium]